MYKSLKWYRQPATGNTKLLRKPLLKVLHSLTAYDDLFIRKIFKFHFESLIGIGNNILQALHLNDKFSVHPKEHVRIEFGFKFIKAALQQIASAFAGV